VIPWLWLAAPGKALLGSFIQTKLFLIQTQGLMLNENVIPQNQEEFKTFF